MQKIKVVHIVEAMLGGIRQHVTDIIDNLDQNQYEIYLIYSNRRADKVFFDEKATLESCASLILCNEMQREIGFHDLLAYKALVKHFKSIKPDIVHCHSSKAGIVGRIAAKRCGVKTIIYTPNAYAFETPDIIEVKKNAYILAERFLSRYATSMTINVSKGELALAKKYKLDKDDKLSLIYNGIPDIELPSKEELKKELDLRNDVHYVGVTARCARQKDPMTFLTIAERLVRSRDDVEFIYIGDGEMMEEMKSFVKYHNLESKVHLLGFRTDASTIVGALDIYLSTALYEGLPYSMIEAMRAGVPIVASDVVGNQELVFNGVNGWLYELGDVIGACNLIDKCLQEKSTLGKNSRNTYINNYSIETMMMKLNSIYKHI